MTVSVHIPTALRPECGDSAEIQVSAPTVRAVLEQLEVDHPALYRSVCDETGAVRRHINLFVNSALLRDREKLDVELQPGDLLGIMTAVSGG